MVTKRVVTREEIASLDLLGQSFEVVRVPINKKLEVPAEVRQEGETTIYPVMEEVMVVVKQLLLKEEIHVTRRTTKTQHQEIVSLQRDDVSIERHRFVAKEKGSEDQ